MHKKSTRIPPGRRNQHARVTPATNSGEQLLGQLQRGGRFLEPAATLGNWEGLRGDACCVDCELRKENRMMTLEAEALKARLLEAQSDGAALRERFERKDSIVERQAEEEEEERDRLQAGEEGRELEIEAGIAQMQRVPFPIQAIHSNVSKKLNFSGRGEGQKGEV